MQRLKISLLLVLSLGLSACFNENEEKRVVLGDVSLGDQLIDLKKAHEAEAINSAEYRQMRQGLIKLIADRDADDDDDDDDDDDKKKVKDRPGPKKDAEEDEGFSWL
jgi:hypothetical protein